MGCDTYWKAYKPLQQIEIMRTLVDEQPAPLAFPRGAPGAGLIVRLGAEPIRDDPMHTADIAEHTSLEHRLDRDIEGPGPFLKHDAKAQCFITVRRQHAVAVRHMHR